MDDVTAPRERRRERATRVNRTHVRQFLDAVRDSATVDEIDEPRDARRMRPHVFGQDEVA